MIRLLMYIVIACIVSGYFFSFSFTFLPIAFNTKLLLAIIGIVLFIIKGVKHRTLCFSKELLGGAFLAALFSLICFISIEYNDTSDFSYVSYISTFFVWVFGAYSVIQCLRAYHGYANITLLTNYLAGVAVFQCIMAILIDQIPALQHAVDSVVYQGQSFLKDVDRLYGIGASLDNAGIRFAIIAVLIAFVLIKNNSVRQNRTYISLLVFALCIIASLGNMISRTTTVGVSLALGVIFLSFLSTSLIIKRNNFRLFGIIIGFIILGISVFVYLYNTDEFMHEQLRFAFEGFFNWVETGEFRTDSTDRLDSIMWVWPETTRGWIIGNGLFDTYRPDDITLVYLTDIGYCRFVLYTGLLGFSSFVLFFIYNAYIFARKIRTYAWMMLVLFILALLIWMKVATDIFIIFAFFYWLDTNNGNQDSIEEDDEEEGEEEDSSSTHHLPTYAECNTITH